MKIILWGVGTLILLLFVASRCGQSPVGQRPSQNTVPSAAAGKLPATSPSAISLTPTPFPAPMEVPRPVTYVPPRNPEQVLPGQVFPIAKKADMAAPLSSPPSPAPTGNNALSATQVLHLDGAPPVARRRR